jgi:hypothetical protein
MNPEKWKKLREMPSKYDIQYTDIDFSKTAIDYDTLKQYLKDIEDSYYNPNFSSTAAVKSCMLDMKVIIGLKRNGEIEIIKNEDYEGGFKYININSLMRMFIKTFRVGIMRFNTDSFKLFSTAIENDLHDAVMGVVKKYKLQPSEISKWEKK